MSHYMLGHQFAGLSDSEAEDQIYADLSSTAEPEPQRRIFNRQRLGAKEGSQGTLFDVESDQTLQGRKYDWHGREQDRLDRAHQAASLLQWRQDVTDNPGPRRKVASGTVIEEQKGSMGTAVSATDLRTQRPVGSLSWYPGKPTYSQDIDGGVIHKVTVDPEHRRQGVATAMLEAARSWNPGSDIRHSKTLTKDGAAWSQARP